MFTIIALVIIIIVAVIGYAATRPDVFPIKRSVSIKAPPEKVFALINDLHQWEGWSPWEKVDPAVKRTYRGTANSKGAVYEWEGNKNVGQGRMEITESVPQLKIVLKLDFIKPFEGHNTVEFMLSSQGENTIVTQTMYGENNFMSKLMGVVFNADKMIGDKYQEGLNNLKNIAEK
jgi:uncharacterized protein YndB with AHSA1/START domain